MPPPLLALLLPLLTCFSSASSLRVLDAGDRKTRSSLTLTTYLPPKNVSSRFKQCHHYTIPTFLLFAVFTTDPQSGGSRGWSSPPDQAHTGRPWSPIQSVIVRQSDFWLPEWACRIIRVGIFVNNPLCQKNQPGEKIPCWRKPVGLICSLSSILQKYFVFRMEQLKFHLLDCVAGQPCSQVFGIPP